LDESTSALDSKSERIVQEALDSIMKQHTSSMPEGEREREREREREIEREREREKERAER